MHCLTDSSGMMYSCFRARPIALPVRRGRNWQLTCKVYWGTQGYFLLSLYSAWLPGCWLAHVSKWARETVGAGAALRKLASLPFRSTVRFKRESCCPNFLSVQLRLSFRLDPVNSYRLALAVPITAHIRISHQTRWNSKQQIPTQVIYLLFLRLGRIRLTVSWEPLNLADMLARLADPLPHNPPQFTALESVTDPSLLDIWSTSELAQTNHSVQAPQIGMARCPPRLPLIHAHGGTRSTSPVILSKLSDQGIDCFVQIDRIPLEVYQAKREGHVSSGYIMSQSGKTFEILVDDKRNGQSKTDLSVQLFIDGTQ